MKRFKLRIGSRGGRAALSVAVAGIIIFGWSGGDSAFAGGSPEGQTTGGPTNGSQTTGGPTTGTSPTTTTGNPTGMTTGMTTGSTSGVPVPNQATTGGLTPPPGVLQPGQLLPGQQGTNSTAGQPSVITVPALTPEQEQQIARLALERAKRGPHTVFGWDFFEGARQQVESRRVRNMTGTSPQAPTSPVVSPSDLGSGGVIPQAPDTYLLGPGDTLDVHYQSPATEPVDVTLKVDDRGLIYVPITGHQIVVRGLTLDQLRRQLGSAIARGLKNAQVTVSLQGLRSIPIQILGESYAPGSYTLPSTVTLFNAIYASGGPTEIGSMRNISLKRPNGTTRTYDLYQLFVYGNGNQDVPLGPGDVIFIPPAGTLVEVKGEVRRPAIYELRQDERLANLLRFAGGVKPTGITQKVEIDSVIPGHSRIINDVRVSGPGSTNPQLLTGDTVDVFSITPEIVNAVVVEGAVYTPRVYELKPGMRISDLISAGRGLLRDAYSQRADLSRLNPDGTRQLIRVDLGRALKNVASENILLKRDDRLHVYSIEDVMSLGTRQVEVKGAVRKPGQYYRADGMRLSDLLLAAGGLAPNASRDDVFLTRTNLDGTPGPIVRINLTALLNGDVKADLTLDDLDALTVQTSQEVKFLPDQMAEISGAVQRPGRYKSNENMRIKDLVDESGGLLPSANPNAIFIQRYNADGTVAKLIKTDWAGILSGDPLQNVSIQPLDRVSIFTKERSQFMPELTVRVSGAVQNPATYPRSDNMHLLDLLQLAGGVLPNAGDTVEIAKSRVADGTPVVRVRVKDVLAGLPAANVALDPGDEVAIATDSEILEKPYVVYIAGAVQKPGPYLVTSTDTKISDIVKRAGGLHDSAFPQGAQFMRNPGELGEPLQGKLATQIVKVLRQVQDDEYKRELSRGDIAKLKAAGDAARAGQVATLAPTTTQSASVLQNPSGLKPLEVRDPVTPARPIGEAELGVAGNVNINLRSALRHPGNKDDLALDDGDAIYIPETPISVAIVGAVVIPSSVRFVAHADLRYYLNHSGGPLKDAALDEIVVIRSSGNVVRARMRTEIEVGDQIFVPTKVMVAKLTSSREDFSFVASQVTSTLIFLALLKGFGL